MPLPPVTPAQTKLWASTEPREWKAALSQCAPKTASLKSSLLPSNVSLVLTCTRLQSSASNISNSLPMIKMLKPFVKCVCLSFHQQFVDMGTITLAVPNLFVIIRKVVRAVVCAVLKRCLCIRRYDAAIRTICKQKGKKAENLKALDDW